MAKPEWMLVDFPEEYTSLSRLIEGGQVGQLKQYFSALHEGGQYNLGVSTFYPFGHSPPTLLSPSDPRITYTDTGLRVKHTMQSLVMIACHHPHYAPAVIKYLWSDFSSHIFLNQLEWCFHPLHSWSCVAPLHVACTGYNQNLRVVSVLVNLGADVNLRTQCCQVTPLHLAVASYGGDQALAIAQFLIDHGAEIDALDGNRDTPLTLMYRCYGCDKLDEILSLLISRKANVNHVNSVGCSALHYAALNIDYHAVSSLLSHGASPLFQLSEHPSPSVPCPLYLTTSEEIADLFTSRPDCPVSCLIDSLLLIGTSKSYSYALTEEYEHKLWKKGITLRESHGLLPAGGRCINGIGEAMSVSEFEEHCSLHQLTEYGNPRFPSSASRYLAVQSLLIKERCLGSFCHLINLSDVDDTMRNYGTDITVNIKCLELLAHSFKNTLLPHWSIGVEKYWRSRLSALSECLRLLGGKIESTYGGDGHSFNNSHIQMYAECCVSLLEAVSHGHNVALCSKTSVMYYEAEEAIWDLLNTLVFWLSMLCKLNFTSEDSEFGCFKSVVKMLVDKCLRLMNTTLLHFIPKRFSDSCVDEIFLLFDFVLCSDGSSVVIDSVSSEGNRPIHCVAENIDKPEHIPLIMSLYENGAHLDAVDSSGKTAVDYLAEAGLTSHLEKYLPSSPLPLMCLASRSIVKESIPYSKLDVIPPRMKHYIALHDSQCCVSSAA